MPLGSSSASTSPLMRVEQQNHVQESYMRSRLVSQSIPHASFMLRRAGVGDAREVTEQFQMAYRNSSHPFQTVASVTDFLAEPRNFQVVAESHGSIVAS